MPDALARPRPEEMQIIGQETDFLGVNYYTRNQVAWDPADRLLNASATAPRLPTTAMGWEVYPEGLFKVLKRVSLDYTKIPLFITENGAAFDDSFAPDGSVIDDGDRIDYLSSHFEAARRVCEGGINLRGYYVWSLMDNLEWAHGYSKRFGLVHVDFQTQRRTLKRSACGIGTSLGHSSSPRIPSNLHDGPRQASRRKATRHACSPAGWLDPTSHYR